MPNISELIDIRKDLKFLDGIGVNLVGLKVVVHHKLLERIIQGEISENIIRDCGCRTIIINILNRDFFWGLTGRSPVDQETYYWCGVHPPPTDKTLIIWFEDNTL